MDPKKTNIVKRKKTRFFEIYISKVLKNISTNGITSNARQQLNGALCIIARKIASTSLYFTQMVKKRTLSEKEVGNAIRILFSGVLSENSIKEGNKAIENFSSNNNDSLTSRQSKASIIFPPSIAEKFLRQFGYTKVMITNNAPIFLAATLEYICSEILELSSETVTINKRMRLTIRDLELGVRNDNELDKLFDSLNISFIGGGVVPYIHPILINSRKIKRKIVKTDTAQTQTKKNHRFRPGTVSIREIRKYQRMSNCLIFAKFPFERLVRTIVSQYNENMKISKDVFTIIQYFIEQYIVDLLRDSNYAAIHAGRVKLMASDINFITSMRDKSFYKHKQNEITPEMKLLDEEEADEVVAEEVADDDETEELLEEN
jgi:histone H3